MKGTREETEIKLLLDLLRVYSPSQQERGVARVLVEAALAAGLRASIDRAGNAVIDAGPGEREVLLLGHMDTVPGEIAVERRGGKIYGRGAVDAKGPLAAFLSALIRVKGRAGDKRIVLVGAVEEEHPSSKGARHICTTAKPDFIIIGEPSGHDAVTLGYKGSLQILYELASSASHAASGSIGAFDGGLAFYSSLRADVEGFNSKRTRLEQLDLAVLDISPSQDPFGQRIGLSLGFRLPLGFDTASLKKKVLALAGDARVTILSEEVPYAGGRRNGLIGAFNRALRSKGMQPRHTFKTGTSDMNIVGPHFNVPIVAYGPGDSLLDHTPEEHIIIKEYLQAIDVLEQVLLEL